MKTLEEIDVRLRDLNGDDSDWAQDQRRFLRGQKRRVRLVAAREKGTHTFLQWAHLVIEFGGRCIKCCREMEGELEKDHIIPLALGGSDAIENIQPLCRWCNATKHLDDTNWVAIRREHGWPFSKVKKVRAA